MTAVRDVLPEFHDLPSASELEARLERAEADIALRQSEAQALRLMLEARRVLDRAAGEAAAMPHSGLKPDNVLVLPSSGSPPSITQAILEVMRTRPDYEWHYDEIFERLRVLGWLPNGPEKRRTMGATLSRMATKQGLLERPGPRGLYKLRAKVAHGK